jgi:hypothetical protein
MGAGGTMMNTSDRRGFRVPNLSGVALLAMAVVVAGVGFVTGGFTLIALAGGFAFGTILLLARRKRGPYTATTPVPRHDPTADWPPSDVINMSRIRVAGVGGLGLVAMALTVALELPRVGATLTIALAGGLAVAIAVILYRRRRGPLPSSGSDAHARTFV